MEPIDIFRGIDALDDLFLAGAQMLRQGQLHEDAVDGFIRVQAVDLLQQGLARRCRGQVQDLRAQADLCARLVFVADIDLRGRVVTDEDDGEARRDIVTALDLLNAFCGILFDLLGKLLARKDSC